MKKSKKQAARDNAKPVIHPPIAPVTRSGINKQTLFMGILLAVVCFGLYINTLDNKYCLDDAMMITENSVTQKGFDGIREHLSHGFLYGFLNREGDDAASSRWRPLALITYSIEIGLWGANEPGKSHFINLLIYTGIVLLLFGLLNKYIFRNNWLAFFAALLFAIHPIHTEVVANIKGRDELLCLLFLLLSLAQLWKFITTEKAVHYIWSLLLFFVSLTAKENSLTFIAGIPLMLYFFSVLKPKKILLYSGGFLVIALFYLLIRNAIVPINNLTPGQDVTNNPFLYATGFEAICTKIYAPLLYLKMIIFPHPLTYDYSYNQIPLVNERNAWVWVSLATYLALFIYALTGIKKKNIVSFCILMFFITLSVSTNFIVEIGMIIGERLLFFPSIFVAIILAVMGNQVVHFAGEKFNINRKLAVGMLITPVLILSTLATVSRNTEWKDDVTLNLADVIKSPNSVRVNGGAGGACITAAMKEGITKKEKDSLLEASIKFLEKSISINPGYNVALLNIGVAYSQMDSLFKAEACWNKVREKDSANPKLKEYDHFLAARFYSIAETYGKRNSQDTAIFYLEKAARYSHESDEITFQTLYNLGGIYYMKGDYQRAYELTGKLMHLNPKFADVATRYKACEQMLAMKNKISLPVK